MSTRPIDAVADRPPRFAVGSAVRVRPGTPDPDYPDIPLGGWAGVVSSVETADVPEPIYLVRWSDETLAAAHPVYRRRCDRDGLEVERAWVGEADLAADDGGPPAVEQPAELRPLPLDLEEPLDRARYLLGLTSDDDLPEVEPSSLRRFHEELSQRLLFPFAAADEDHHPILVRRLLPPEEASEEEGLLAEASRDDDEPEQIPLVAVQVPEGTVGRRDLEAYQTWFDGPADVFMPLGTWRPPLLRLAAVVVFASALVGAALAALDEAAGAAQVGAVLLGLVGAMLGSGAESLFRRVMRLPPGFVGGLTLGLLFGGLAGGALAALVAAYAGAIPGAVAGTLLGRLRNWLAGTRGGVGRLTLACAWVGGMAYVFLTDPWPATWGSLRGLLAGVALCAVAYFGIKGYMAAALRGLGRDE